MTDFYEVYVRIFALALPVLAVATGSLGAIRAGLRPTQFAAFAVVSAALFGLWYAAAMPLSRKGVFNVPANMGEPPVVLVFLFAGAFAIWALAWLTPLGRRLTDATPLSAIAAFQIPRLMGGCF